MNGEEQKTHEAQQARIAVLEAVLREREKAVEKALDAAQKAVDKADTNVTRRLEGFPQIYVTRAEADIQIGGLTEAVQELRDRMLEKDYYIREHTSLVNRVNALDAERAKFITLDKYEDKLKSEATARETALLRVDEKFEDYVKRYEQRQREVDLLLAAQEGATREARSQATRIQYATNRNIAALGVALTVIIVIMNIIGIV